MKIAKNKLILGLFGLCFLLSIGSLCFGDVDFKISDYYQSLIDVHSLSAQIIWSIRLPRTLTAMMVGLMLGISGALMQGLLRNPMAEPGILGVSTSAGLGAALVIVFGLGQIPMAIEAGALFLSFLSAVLILVFIRWNSDRHGLILFGVGLSSLMGALMALAFNLSPSPIATADILSWLMGSVENRGFNDVLVCLIPLLFASIMVPKISTGLRRLIFGEDTATSLGIDIKQLQFLIVITVALLSGISVAVCGVIGFVGLASPHLVRLAGIRDPGDLVWPSGLMGAVIVQAADLVIKMSPTMSEIRLGVLTSLIGAPLFVIIARKANSKWGTGS